MHNLDTYHKTVVEMENAGVDPEYLQGWQGGFLINPKREEQRVNDAYNAGYEDGTNGATDKFKEWVK